MNELLSLAYYWASLEGRAEALPISEADTGQLGYWRTKNGAIAIWAEYDKDGQPVGDTVYHSIDRRGQVVKTKGLPQIPGFAFALPVSFDDYMVWRTEGHWPGQIPGLGHNTGQLSSFEEWLDNVTGQCEDALRWLHSKPSIACQTDADIAANYRDSINKLVKKGEALSKEEREPLDAQIKEIRKRWGAPIEAAGEAIRELRTAVGAFLSAEALKEEMRAAAENRRLAEERRALEDQDISLAAIAEPVEEVKPKKVGAGGQLGRKTGLREVYKPVITDYAQVLEFFKDDPVIQEAVQRLCAAEARSKTRRTIPGLEYVKSKEAI